MHVAYNLLHLVPGETGGAEVYARRLLPALRAADPDLEMTLFLGGSAASEDWGEGVDVVPLRFDPKSRVRRVLAEQTLLPRAVRAAAPDLLHNLFNTAPVLPQIPQVTTIHDLVFKRHPESGLLAKGVEVVVPLAARRSTRIVTDSEASKSDLVRFLDVPAESVDVAPLGPGLPDDAIGPSPDELRASLELGDSPLVLSVLAKRPHKNAARLIEAFARVPDGVLVIPGYSTRYEQELEGRIEELELGSRVRLLGWVDDATLDGLYRAADCFVFPSLAEGFGLPVLEAMLRGAPVACSNATSLPEVAGDAALLFDPLDVDAIAVSVRRILEDRELAERLRDAGLQRAQRFSWDETAPANARVLPKGDGRLTRFGIDARAAVEEPAGRGRYVRELLRALAARDDGHVFELFARFRWDEELDERFSWRLIDSGDPIWHLRTARAASSTVDAFLSTNSYLTAWFLRAPSVVVVYDLVTFRPEVQPRRSSGRIERATIGLGVRRAHHLLCISEATKNDLVARYPRAAPKSSVVPLAADARFGRAVSKAEVTDLRERYGLSGEFVLCTGTLEPRKNLLRVLEAHANLSPHVELVLVGPTGWEFDEILERAAGRESVRVLGHVPDEDLVALYNACAVFCYPSLYEGFGLPLLEAMSAGAACVTSSVSSLPEVGGDAVVYVDPTSVEEIRSSLERLLGEPEERRRHGDRARLRAAEFSWNRTAAETLDALVAATR